MRIAATVVCLAVMLTACGESETSLTEYAESVQAGAIELGGQLEAGDARMASTTPTIETAREVIAGAVAHRNDFQAKLQALDPPAVLAELHADLVDFHAEIILAQEAFSERAQSATDLAALDESAEALNYRTMQADLSLCQELQSRIDATAVRAEFADVPWVPEELKDVVEVTLWC